MRPPGALLGALLTCCAMAGPAGAELSLEHPAAAPAAGAQTPRGATAQRPASQVANAAGHLQIGCEGAATAACRGASTQVEIGQLVRENRARGGIAIQHTLIGSGR